MKTVVGKVISDKMPKTVVVEMTIKVAHPKYSKLMSKTRKFHAHNELGAKVGDNVRLVEIKPMSRTKNWKVEAVI